MPPALDSAQLDRYARQIVMDDVGPDGQQRLLDGSALVVGLGGLGSPVVQYLAAAGVGRLGVLDDDTVERSNLQRQVIHTTADVGRPKVDSAAAFIAKHNPDVDVERYEMHFESDTELHREYDVVVDATDSIEATHALNDACVETGVPLVHGAVSAFDGQVLSIDGGDPCYRCLVPDAPAGIADCATTGVIGATTGVIGSLQATEALKVLLGSGNSLEGRLLRYDGKTASFTEVPFESRPDCAVCGE